AGAGARAPRVNPPIRGRCTGGRKRSLVLYDALAEAVRRESNAAVAYHWGVTGQTGTVWRGGRGGGRVTRGTRAVEGAGPGCGGWGGEIVTAATREGSREPRTLPRPVRRPERLEPPWRAGAAEAAAGAVGSGPLVPGRARPVAFRDPERDLTELVEDGDLG